MTSESPRFQQWSIPLYTIQPCSLAAFHASDIVVNAARTRYWYLEIERSLCELTKVTRKLGNDDNLDN